MCVFRWQVGVDFSSNKKSYPQGDAKMENQYYDNLLHIHRPNIHS